MTNEYVKIDLTVTKRAVGAPIEGGEFTFGLFDHQGAELYTAVNNAGGVVTFHNVTFYEAGQYHYTIKETAAPGDWETDPAIWPVTIDVSRHEHGLQAKVTYPNGPPVFENTKKNPCCGAFEFPPVCYSRPGVYELTLKELTPPGDGWQTDSKEIPVIVTVTDDGHGHLVASVHYPDGFPVFKNIYHAAPACVVIHGCKIAIGAPLPAGKFEFGLFNEAGELIATATNAAAEACEADCEEDYEEA